MTRYDTIEEVRKHSSEARTFYEILKYNENHDSLGRFSSSPGAAAGTSAGGKYQKLSHADATAMAGEMGQNDIPKEEVDRMLDRSEGYFGTPNSFTINEKLRMNDPKRDELAYSEEELKTIDTLDKNMKPSTRDVQLHRMIGDSFLDAMGISDDISAQDYDEDGLKEMQKAVGKVYTNAGYTSTSFDMADNAFKHKKVQLNINAPKGTKMLVSPDRWYDGEIAEAEILLARGSAMKITAIRPRMWHGRISGIEVDCEVIVD